jgi:hypothetical protein
MIRLYIQTIEVTQNANDLASDGALGAAILSVVDPQVSATDHKHPASVASKKIRAVIKNLFRDFKAAVLRTRDARAQFLGKVDEWITGPEVAEWYGTLTPELKELAIKNTRGYLAHAHWVIPRGETIKLGGGSPFAKLDIGAKAVMKVLESARGELMDEVFGIFDQVSAMSDSLNSFFANGLQEPKQAKAAAQSADDVGTDTRKIAGIDK